MSDLSTDAGTDAAPETTGRPAAPPSSAPRSDAASPAQNDDAPAPDTGDAEVHLDTDTETEGVDQDAADAIAEMFELEMNGQKYQVPAALKDAFMANDAFTQKTQSFAKERDAIINGLQEQFHSLQAREQHINELAQVEMLNARIAQYEGDPRTGQGAVNWVQWAAQNPQEAQQHQTIYNDLLRQRDGIKSRVDEQIANTLQQQEQAQRVAVMKAQPEIEARIPGWNKELAQNLTKHAVESLNIPMDMLNQMNAYPWAVEMLHAHFLQKNALAGAQPQNLPKTQPKPNLKTKGTAPAGKDPEKMSTKDWMKWRNEQVAKARGR